MQHVWIYNSTFAVRFVVRAATTTFLHHYYHLAIYHRGQSSTTMSESPPANDGLMAKDRHGLRAALLNS